jgi:hypothetical protein
VTRAIGCYEHVRRLRRTFAPSTNLKSPEWDAATHDADAKRLARDERGRIALGDDLEAESERQSLGRVVDGRSDAAERRRVLYVALAPLLG